MKKKFDRNTEGLRDALMCEMEDIREGIATPEEANAFASLAEKVIKSLEADLARDLFQHKKEQDIESNRIALLEMKAEEQRNVA
jgi:hypothetical protein